MPKKILAAMLVLLLTGCSGPSLGESGIGTELSTAPPITENGNGASKSEDQRLSGSRDKDEDDDERSASTASGIQDRAGSDNGAVSRPDRPSSKTSRISEPEAQVKPKTQGRPKGFEFKSGILEFGKFDPVTFDGELLIPAQPLRVRNTAPQASLGLSPFHKIGSRLRKAPIFAWSRACRPVATPMVALVAPMLHLRLRRPKPPPLIAPKAPA